MGSLIQEVIHYRTLRGKFFSVHPELRREGIIRVEVGEEGLRFVRDTGQRFSFESIMSYKKKLEESLVFNQSADDFGKAPDYLVACEDEDEEELLRRAIALSLEESEENYLAS